MQLPVSIFRHSKSFYFPNQNEGSFQSHRLTLTPKFRLATESFIKVSTVAPISLKPTNTFLSYPPRALTMSPQLEKVPDTEGTDDQTEVQQLTPHDQWDWNSRHHWKHWHGLWSMWQPTEGPGIAKIYKSVRSLWPVDKDHVHLYHRNQWYESSGEGPDINWEGGPWAMYELKHSLQDGIWHPNSIDHRIIQFPNGDLGWVQLALKPNDPKSVVFNEMHFMASPDARAPVILGYDFEGKMGVALMLEETRDNDKRPEPSWQGTIWKHHRAPLEESRSEPEGTFVGTEMSINTHLKISSRKAVWKGFRGGLSEEDASAMDCKYILIHLPYGFTVFAPLEAAIGKAHAYYVSWVVNENKVRVISTRYFADGRLQYVKSGTYDKSA